MKFFLIAMAFMLLLLGSLVRAKTSVKYTKVYYTIIEQKHVKISTTQKGMNNYINLSFFNINTRKVVPVGLKNRPFIIKRNNEILFSDNMKEILPTDETASVGSWLIKDNKKHFTKDGFSQSFKNQITNRTIVAKKGTKIYLIVITNSSYDYCRKMLLKMNINEAVAVDGGSSSQFKSKGKLYLKGKKCVNYIGSY